MIFGLGHSGGPQRERPLFTREDKTEEQIKPM